MLLHSTSGPLSAAELTSYGTALQKLPGVGSVAAPAVSADRRTADYPVTLSYDPVSTKAVNAMKNSIMPGAHAAAPRGTYALVGGTTAVYSAIQRAIDHRKRVGVRRACPRELLQPHSGLTFESNFQCEADERRAGIEKPAHRCRRKRAHAALDQPPGQ